MSTPVPDRATVERAVRAVFPDDAAIEAYLRSYDEGWFPVPNTPDDPMGLALSVLSDEWAEWFVRKCEESEETVQALRRLPADQALARIRSGFFTRDFGV